MEFLLLVFINLIMGTIFYLILRLRLEKYASDYREKRLRREMDEIINEFNETADRNITILENRIEYLKKLLEKSGKITSIDIKINNEIEKITNLKSVNNDYNSKVIDRMDDIDVSIVEPDDNKKKHHYSKGTLFPLTKIFNILNKKNILKMTGFFNVRASNRTMLTETNDNNYRSENNIIDINNRNKISTESSLQKENIEIVFDMDRNLSVKPKIENIDFSERRLEEMFSSSEDKYLLVSDLYNQGYPPDLIAKCSGIPIGEINLVLDLSNSL